MIGKLGKFKIEVADSIISSISQAFITKQRLGNHPLRLASGKWDESISFSGVCVLENSSHLDDLKAMVKKAKPISFVIGNAVYAMVIIESIDFTKSIFLENGLHIKEEFKVNLKRYFSA